jgi:hypothetical protein
VIWKSGSTYMDTGNIACMRPPLGGSGFAGGA